MAFLQKVPLLSKKQAKLQLHQQARPRCLGNHTTDQRPQTHPKPRLRDEEGKLRNLTRAPGEVFPPGSTGGLPSSRVRTGLLWEDTSQPKRTAEHEIKLLLLQQFF